MTVHFFHAVRDPTILRGCYEIINKNSDDIFFNWETVQKQRDYI
jgi:hypothetical protein